MSEWCMDFSVYGSVGDIDNRELWNSGTLLTGLFDLSTMFCSLAKVLERKPCCVHDVFYRREIRVWYRKHRRFYDYFRVTNTRNVFHANLAKVEHRSSIFITDILGTALSGRHG